MANLKIKPSKYMLNLLHVLDPFVNEEEKIINGIVEILKGSINKYELITETGHLKLDRVGYSSLAYPFSYGAIPKTLDLDNDPLDVIIYGMTEQLVPGCLVELRVIGLMKFSDDNEQDDKIIAVLNDDKRFNHIQKLEDLGEYFLKETKYFWEHYKDLKKSGTGVCEGFFDANEAIKVIKECAQRYDENYKNLFED